MKSIIAWFRQPTTVAGFSVLLGTLSALLANKISATTAIPLLIGAVTSMAIPDNSGAQAKAVTLASTVLQAESGNLRAAAIQVASKVLAVLAVLGLTVSVAGCGLLSSTPSSSQIVVSGTNYAITSVDAAEVALTAAENIAAVYIKFPLCPQPAGTLCSVAATSTELKNLGKAADADLAKVKAGVANVSVMVADINALTAATPAVTVTTTTGS